MNVTRRGLIRAAAGAALVAANTSIFDAPTIAWAIAGVDDVVVGGAVLVLLTLAGYAVSSEVSEATLSAMGYSFSDFAQDASHQSAAVGRAIADANNLGVEVNRMQAESAAAAIAAGTGAAGEWLSDMATTGRMALDGWVNGAGAEQAALWGLVAEFASQRLSALPTPANDAVVAGTSMGAYISNGTTVVTSDAQSIMAMYTRPLIDPIDPDWAVLLSDGQGFDTVIFGTAQQGVRLTPSGGNIRAEVAQGKDYPYYNYTFAPSDTPQAVSTMTSAGNYGGTSVVASDLVITGDTLPGVDRAADAPETYGAGYDKTILGDDLVIDGNGDVVSAGTIQLPVEYPHVQLPYVDGLYGLGAGVVPGILDVPIAGTTPVVVGTQTGVVSMPISDALAADTSIAGTVTPTVPVVPPGTPDVGPWTPAYDLPFGEVWPFNVIYTFVQELSVLGGR